jgi:hypothetical protein
LEATPGKHLIYSLQKKTILGTSHIARKYSSLEIEGGAEWITVGSAEVRGRTGL